MILLFYWKAMYHSHITTTKTYDFIPETKIYPFSYSNRHSLSIRFDTGFPDTIGFMYSKSICINWTETDSWTSGKLCQCIDASYNAYIVVLFVFLLT